ncbi:phospholipase D-like domain-containing protein [Shuttleworthella satelles]|uniref:Phospholipase D domain protein n=1 Tax=Shuttleworthella satelles DSM 14600 TaxID=626523 RepID=C4GC41_9FIRM|nr:phospholipase D-like domain-containing protein [Shuttleworthia satelles]EEP27983.1 phospholipase D domain protein [Shuttleworthia satelles DSM 14600]
MRKINSLSDIREMRLLKRGKKRLIKLVYGRTFIMSALIILQILFVVALVDTLNRYGPYMYMFSMAVTVISVLHIFNSDSDPSVKLSWLLFVAVGSPFGALFYVYVRSDVGHRRLKKQISRILKYTSQAQPDMSLTMKAIEDCRPERSAFAHYMNDTCGYHPYPVTNLKYYPLGDDFLPDFLEDLSSARHFIFLEYFIVSEGQMWGKILYILSQKVKEGVEVRLMYDGTNEFTNLPHNYPAMLEKLGIACRIFDPVRPFVSTEYNYRDHRKIAVIDGKTAYTGGLNLADEYINVTHPYGHWKDVAIRSYGDGVATFTRLFLESWNYQANKPMPEENRYIEASTLYGLLRTGGGQRVEEARELLQANRTDRADQGDRAGQGNQGHWADLGNMANQADRANQVRTAVDRIVEDGFVIPYADNPLDGERMGEQVYLDILQTASDYVYIMTPYLILDETMVNALTYATKRGIDVRIILPHIPDKRYAFALAKTHYRELLEAGVKIYEYTPGFVHAKVFVSDDRRATVGSINLDYRSLYHHFEVGLYVDGNRVIGDILEDFQKTLDKCQQISLEDTRAGGFRNRFDRALGAVFKLLAPML